jgi:ribonuclease III, bacterial
MNELEARLGYTFSRRELLEHALTHSSWSNERGSGRLGSNERLEFLGDSVLGWLVAETLYHRFPQMPEGDMTRLRAELVCESSLAEASETIGLGQYLRLGRGEEQGGGRQRPSIIADAFEATLAAVYIDGGEGPARAMVERFILSKLKTAARSGSNDHKTVLQEAVQHLGMAAPIYRMVGESGPDHNKVFSAQVLYDGRVAGEGSGRSKKEAEQAAAKNALDTLRAEGKK